MYKVYNHIRRLLGLTYNRYALYAEQDVTEWSKQSVSMYELDIMRYKSTLWSNQNEALSTAHRTEG